MGGLQVAGQGVTGNDRIVTAILMLDEMTEPLKRARRSGAEGAGDTKEYGLSERVTVQDVDQEVGLALTSLGCEFNRREARGVVLSTIQKCTTFTEVKVYHFTLDLVSFPDRHENDCLANSLGYV